MGKSHFTTNDPLTKQVYEEKLFREQRIGAYWDRFMGESADSAVQVKTNLEGKKGDKIIFGYIGRLEGEGVGEGETLEGNEEAISTHDDKVTLTIARHGVRDEGELDAQRPMLDIRKEGADLLRTWGSEKIDSLAMTAAFASPTVTFYLDSSGDIKATSTWSTAKAALDATNSKLTLDFVTRLSTWARNGGNRTYNPIRPIRVDGSSYLVLLVHDDGLADLKTSSEWKQAQREAEVRGEKNPLFRDAKAIWNGVVIHSHESVPIGTDAGGSANVPYTKGLLFGAQALLWAWGKRPKMIQKDFDYEDEVGHGWRMIYGVKKPVFNSKDYGSIQVCLARKQISDLTIS